MIRQYLKLAGVSLGLCVVLVGLGYLPTLRLSGTEAIPAMLMGCGISLAASIVGSAPIVSAGRAPGPDRSVAILLSTAIRFGVVMTLALAAALSGLIARRPLLVWVAISYVVLLIADTLFAVRIGRSDGPAEV